MRKFKWRSLGEIVGLLSVVASLLFVGFQLKQDQILGRSDLASDSFNGKKNRHPDYNQSRTMLIVQLRTEYRFCEYVQCLLYAEKSATKVLNLWNKLLDS